ncbi:MAG: hypothetical protein Q8K07_15325 [Methylicorpusculum sp.]|uniref:IS66 family insertion sequence element accessory protein TnpA n=1 Tax=Methylicorpusculum sp. TaxID=2713644 RepID=UPI002730A974|nr:hypothetical protein [Methylicorpusculum sp.]MDP2203394.1 hypothetical protein [Methylicorpusculum sp.]
MAAIESTSGNDFWQHHIAQWQASGLSQAGYCRQQALSAHQLSYWKRKFQSPCQAIAHEPATGFVRVQVASGVEASSVQGLSLRLNDGTQLTGITPANVCLIKQLLEVLR